MLQQTLAEVTFEQYRTPTRREQFLNQRNRVVPWTELVAVIEPIYPKAEGPGRPPVGVERMLRLHCLQQWFNLSDPAVEEALYDSRAMRQFVGIDLGREPVPDETTLCTFRHLLETHQLGEQLFARIGAYLATHGLKVSRGPSSMPPSSVRPVRQRIGRKSGIPRCSRPRRATSGTSA
jgi:IS5 family transposase